MSPPVQSKIFLRISPGNKYEKLLNSDRRHLTAVPPSKYGLGYRFHHQQTGWRGGRLHCGVGGATEPGFPRSAINNSTGNIVKPTLKVTIMYAVQNDIEIKFTRMLYYTVSSGMLNTTIPYHISPEIKFNPNLNPIL